MSDAEVQAFISAAAMRRVEAGAPLFEEGQQLTAAIVVAGSVMHAKPLPNDGVEEVELQAGACLGERALFVPLPAVEDEFVACEGQPVMLACLTRAMLVAAMEKGVSLQDRMARAYELTLLRPLFPFNLLTVLERWLLLQAMLPFDVDADVKFLAAGQADDRVILLLEGELKETEYDRSRASRKTMISLHAPCVLGMPCFLDDTLRLRRSSISSQPLSGLYIQRHIVESMFGPLARLRRRESRRAALFPLIDFSRSARRPAGVSLWSLASANLWAEFLKSAHGSRMRQQRLLRAQVDWCRPSIAVKQLARLLEGILRKQAPLRSDDEVAAVAAFLRCSPFYRRLFSELADAQVRELSRHVMFSQYSAGHIMFDEGSTGTTAYVIVSGRVQLCHRRHVVREVGATELFGESVLSSSQRRPVTATAVEWTQLVAITRTSLDRVMMGSGARRDMFHVLRRLPLLASLDIVQLHQLMAALRPRAFDRGDLVIAGGRPAPAWFILRRGTVRLTVPAADGSQLQVALVTAPTAVGSSALLAHSARLPKALTLEAVYAASPVEAYVLQPDSFSSLPGSVVDALLQQLKRERKWRDVRREEGERAHARMLEDSSSRSKVDRERIAGESLARVMHLTSRQRPSTSSSGTSTASKSSRRLLLSSLPKTHSLPQLSIARSDDLRAHVRPLPMSPLTPALHTIDLKSFECAAAGRRSSGSSRASTGGDDGARSRAPLPLPRDMPLAMMDSEHDDDYSIDFNGAADPEDDADGDEDDDEDDAVSRRTADAYRSIDARTALWPAKTGSGSGNGSGTALFRLRRARQPDGSIGITLAPLSPTRPVSAARTRPPPSPLHTMASEDAVRRRLLRRVRARKAERRQPPRGVASISRYGFVLGGSRESAVDAVTGFLLK
eukprot:PLAT5330.2.p1 GENE.PLAT5330.2~~PLAT5330.2.p1  ORF type:complete len:1031 (-),score=273.70 PLAT5330.2:135-2834(-)